MISPWELWACANETIRQYGDRAIAHAEDRMLDLLIAENEAGALTWTAIRDRIEQLQAAGDGSIH